MPKPIDVLRLYNGSIKVQQMVHFIIENCPVPTFIPIFNNFVGIDEQNPRDCPNTAALVLAHATQVLMFAPTSWSPDITYSANPDAYPHRYPLPYGPNQDRVVANKFSLEDLNRAIYLIFAFQIVWSGYHDPAWKPSTDEEEGLDIPADINIGCQLDMEESILDQKREADQAQLDQIPPLRGLDAVDFHETVMNLVGSSNLSKRLKEKAVDSMPRMSLRMFKQVIRILKKIHGIQDPADKLDKIKDTLTFVDELVDKDMVEDYLSKVRDDDTMINYAKTHPGEMDGLVEQLRKQASLEVFMASLQPKQKHDLNDLCRSLGLTLWPDIRLYPKTNYPHIQPIKPHQVLDAATIIERAETTERHTFLSNAIGTEKTRTYLLSIRLHVRRLQERQKGGEDVDFYPSLIVTPVNSLVQTYFEAKSCFPDLKLVVFFGQRSTFADKGAKVLSTNELTRHILGLDSKDPESGLTVVFTTYTTLSMRFQTRHDQLLFRPENVTPAIQKRRDQRQHALKEENDNDNDDDDDDDGDSDIEEAVDEPNKRQRKVPQFSAGQIQTGSIIITDDLALADGNLVTYSVNNPSIPDLKFNFLVFDEAHVAKKANGSYNNVFRQFQWSNLL
ncbi:hypothetical protein ACHAPT_007075 [Fusarium lateritium]